MSEIETVEAAIVAQLLAEIDYLAAPGAMCKGVSDFKTVMTLNQVSMPGAIVAWSGETAVPGQSPLTINRADARTEWRWNVYLVAKSFGQTGEGRLGAVGAYQMVDDVFAALAGFQPSTDTKFFYVDAKPYKVDDARVIYRVTYRHNVVRLAS